MTFLMIVFFFKYIFFSLLLLIMSLSCVFYVKCCINYAVNVVVSLFSLKNLLKLFDIAYKIVRAFFSN